MDWDTASTSDAPRTRVSAQHLLTESTHGKTCSSAANNDNFPIFSEKDRGAHDQRPRDLRPGNCEPRDCSNFGPACREDSNVIFTTDRSIAAYPAEYD